MDDRSLGDKSLPDGSELTRILKASIKPALWLLVTLLLVNFTLRVADYYAQRRGEFVHYLVSSKVIADGRGAAHFYDNGLFREEIANLGYEGNDIYYPNPPTTALLFLPLSKLDFQPARWAWVTISLLSLILALAIQLHELKLSVPWTLVAIAIVLLSQPLQSELQRGQIYTFLLLLTTLTWLGFRRNKQAFTGFVYAGMIATKLFALPLLLLFLLRRCWKTILISLITLGVIALVSLPLLTTAAWWGFLHIPRRILEDPTHSVTAFQSLQSLILHLLTYQPEWNPQPILNNPNIASTLLWIFQLLVIFLTIYAIRVSGESDLTFAAVIALGIFLSPFAQDYTYTVMLLPIVILIANLQEKPSTRRMLITLIAILLYAADIPFKSPRLASGFWALLAYPKLYSGIILWGLLIGSAISRYRNGKLLGSKL